MEVVVRCRVAAALGGFIVRFMVVTCVRSRNFPRDNLFSGWSIGGVQLTVQIIIDRLDFNSLLPYWIS